MDRQEINKLKLKIVNNEINDWLIMAEDNKSWVQKAFIGSKIRALDKIKKQLEEEDKQ